MFAIKKILLVLLFSLAAFGLVSCGGGDDSASTGTPEVAEATIAQPTIAQTVELCSASATYGGTGPLLTATTAPTLAQCADALPGNATGNPWTVYSNGGCAISSSNSGGSGPALTQAQQNVCFNAIAYDAPTSAQCNAYGGYWNYNYTYNSYYCIFLGQP